MLALLLGCVGTSEDSGAKPACVDAWYADLDGDGFGAGTAVTACDPPAGFVTTDDDCDDHVAAAHPGAPEVCDGFDDDCDGTVDVGATDAQVVYADTDGDGWGGDASTACAGLTRGGDCDDTAAAVNPGATETCDGVDDDCDGTVDVGAADAVLTYVDVDGDGWGGDATFGCGGDSVGGDCDDVDPDVHPGAAEVCDGVDDDCDGTVDLDAVDAVEVYADGDGDGWGGAPFVACDGLAVGGDCDDTDARVHPGATEVCDTVDDDCDGTIDVGATDALVIYTDEDGDGWGGTETTGCSGLTVGGDCDDTTASVNPGAVELCDGVDDDCDGTVDVGAADVQTWYSDSDGDGWGGTETTGCTPETDVTVGGDCDDTDAAVNPAAPELCDGADQDCDGAADDGLSATTSYADADGDGFGDPTRSVTGCDTPPGYVANSRDCDDGDALHGRVCPGDCSTRVAYAGSLTLDSTLAMRSFCGSYDAVDGDLTIDASDATNLADLSCLCDVAGNLDVAGLADGGTLLGLDALTQIGGSLSVTADVPDLRGLDHVTTIGGSVELPASVLDYTGLGALATVGTLAPDSGVLDFSGLDALGTVTGDLTVAYASNLTGLEALTSVGGTVELTSIALPTLEPLAALRHVGALWLSGTRLLPSLTGLDALETVDGDLTLESLQVPDLTPLASLTTLGGTLSLEDCDALVSLDGLDGVTTLGGLSVLSNSALADISALAAVTTLSGDLIVMHEDQLFLLDLPDLGSVGGSVVLQNNGSGGCVGLDSLTTVGGDLYLYDGSAGCDAVTTVGAELYLGLDAAGMRSVREVGSLSASSSADVTGLDALELVHGDLELTGATLASTLQALRTVDGDVTIQSSTLDGGLPLLDAVGGDLSLRRGKDTGTASVCPVLTSVGGTLTLSTTSTPALAGFTALTTLGGLEVSSAAYTALPDFAALTETGDVTLKSNTGIVTLDGLDTLRVVDGDLTVTANTVLDDVTALDGLTTVGGDFTFTTNGGIDPAEAEALRDTIGLENIHGTVTISE